MTHLLSGFCQKEMAVLGPCSQMGGGQGSSGGAQGEKRKDPERRWVGSVRAPKREGGRGSSELPWEPRGEKNLKTNLKGDGWDWSMPQTRGSQEALGALSLGSSGSASDEEAAAFRESVF